MWLAWVEKGFGSEEAEDFADQVKVWAGRTRGQRGVRSPGCPKWRKSEGRGSFGMGSAWMWGREAEGRGSGLLETNLVNSTVLSLVSGLGGL